MRENEKFYHFVRLIVAYNFGLILLMLFPAVLRWIFPDAVIENSIYQTSFSGIEGRFGDFYAPMRYALDRNLFNDEMTNSPPFLHLAAGVIGWIISGVSESAKEAVEAGTFAGTMGGYFVWLVPVAAAGAVICRCCTILLQEKKWYVYGIAAVMCSYPFLYAIDRGNMVLFAVMFLILFMTDLEKHPYRAAVWLGLAAALKLYPAILGLCFLKKKNWKAAGVCASVGVLATLLSLAVFSTDGVGFAVTLADWIKKAQSYGEFGNGVLSNFLINNNSIQGVPIAIETAKAEVIDMVVIVEEAHWAAVLRTVFLIVAVVGSFFVKEECDVFLICTVAMICYPVESAVYNVILMVVPLFCRLYKEWDLPVAVLGFLMLMDKGMVCYTVQDGYVLTLHTVIQPLCGIVLVGYLLFRRWRQRDKSEIGCGNHAGSMIQFLSEVSDSEH